MSDPDPDRVRRFVLERHPIRGHAVRVGRGWLNLREHQDYPPAVQQLLGEAVAAVVLLAATLLPTGLALVFAGQDWEAIRCAARCGHKVRGGAVCCPVDAANGPSLTTCPADDALVAVAIPPAVPASTETLIPPAGFDRVETLVSRAPRYPVRTPPDPVPLALS